MSVSIEILQYDESYYNFSTNAGLVLFGPLGTNFNKKQHFSLKKITTFCLEKCKLPLKLKKKKYSNSRPLPPPLKDLISWGIWLNQKRVCWKPCDSLSHDINRNDIGLLRERFSVVFIITCYRWRYSVFIIPSIIKRSIKVSEISWTYFIMNDICI